MKYEIRVSYLTNKSYPNWKSILSSLIVDGSDIDNPYRIEDCIKEQHQLDNNEYISELEWDVSNAKEVED